jgi:hypothetical protein
MGDEKHAAARCSVLFVPHILKNYDKLFIFNNVQRNNANSKLCNEIPSYINTISY